MQRLQGEGRVADPRVAVVPVALAARGLRQRRGERGDRRAGRHVGQALDRERRPLDRLAPPVVGHARAIDPVAPEAGGRLDPARRVVGVGGGGELLRPRQRAEQPLAVLEDVARTHAVALDAHRHVGLQPDRHPGAGGVRGVAVRADQRPLGGLAPVVEDRLADQLDLDRVVDALDGAHQQVLGVVVGRRPRVRGDRVLGPPRADGERVADDDPAAGRAPGGDEHVRARVVAARHRVVDAERAEPERACPAVEQRPEHARGVELRDAQPVDRAVGRDQGAGVAVGQEPVVGDRGERRRHRRALRLDGRGGLAVGLADGHDATHGACQCSPSPSSSSPAAGPQLPGA